MREKERREKQKKRYGYSCIREAECETRAKVILIYAKYAFLKSWLWHFSQGAKGKWQQFLKTIYVLVSVYVFVSVTKRQREKGSKRKLCAHDERGGQRSSMLWSVLKRGSCAVVNEACSRKPTVWARCRCVSQCMCFSETDWENVRFSVNEVSYPVCNLAWPSVTPIT